MRQLIFVLLCAALLSNSAYAQEIKADKIPSAVSSAFKSKFPAATKTDWEMEDGNYEAEFKMNGEEMSANFDKEGKWIETETEIKVSALPGLVSAALKKEFPDWKIEKAS